MGVECSVSRLESLVLAEVRCHYVLWKVRAADVRR